MTNNDTPKPSSLQASSQALAYLRSIDPNIGTEDTGGPSMFLSVVRNPDRAILQNGKPAEIGQIYHTGTQEAWDDVDAAFVVAKRASLFSEWDEQNNDWNRRGAKQNVMLVGGFIMGSKGPTPFLYKVRGMNYTTFIEYQDRLKTWKDLYKLPMLSLKVTLTSKMVKNQQSSIVRVLVPTIQEVAGQPQLFETEQLKMNMEKVPGFERMIQDYINKNLGVVDLGQVDSPTPQSDFDPDEVVDLTK